MQTTLRKEDEDVAKSYLFQDVAAYWQKDIWFITDEFFKDYEKPKRSTTRKIKLNFTVFQGLVKEEIKYYYAYKLEHHMMKISTLLSYGELFERYADFLQKEYPAIYSVVDIPDQKAKKKWMDYLEKSGVTYQNGKPTSNKYTAVHSGLYSFYEELYDERDELEKDIWDFRKIPGAAFTRTTSTYKLNFTRIPLPFRELAKRYMKTRITHISLTHCIKDLISLSIFFHHIHDKYPLWKDLNNLERRHMEDYLSVYPSYVNGGSGSRLKYLVCLRLFLDYIWNAEYPEAPIKSVVGLFFPEDMPKLPSKWEGNIKYIPLSVLEQLEKYIEEIRPAELIPAVILLRVSGWRTIDILGLRYNSCLEKTENGWYLCGDITKTFILGHRIPITEDIAVMVEQLCGEAESKSTPENNPDKLLFNIYHGQRRGIGYRGESIRTALNQLAKEKQIVDERGKIFYFKNHAFRHTKGVELINNGMNILHVQKWMAHVSPTMTMQYARILDDTLRKSWVETMKNGLFKITPNGELNSLVHGDGTNEDIIEWEYIKANLDAVRMPLGYCFKPHKQECHSQLNPCLTCRSLCTTSDFIPQFEEEIRKVQELIETGRQYNLTLWIEKNQALLERYEKVLVELRRGKTHHLAGKKGREYTNEQQ